MLAELDAFGFTVIENAASPGLVERLRLAVLATTETRENLALEIVDGKASLQGMKYQNHLLIKDRCFEEALMLERPLALVKYLAGDSCIFIYPGYTFRSVDALITNFHLPESTLIMLVSAFAGRDHIMQAYREAVEREYRFFSYGDAMFILPMPRNNA